MGVHWPIVVDENGVLIYLTRFSGGPEAEILLADTGVPSRVPYADWEAFVNQQGELWDRQPQLQRPVVTEVLPRIRGRFPTARHLDAAADWPSHEAEQRRLRELAVARRAEEEAAQKARDAQRNERNAELAARLAAQGLACPHCGRTRSDHRHVEPSSLTRGVGFSVCADCGRSFAAHDGA